MEIQELRKNPHLSASSINSYLECGLQYKFSRIDKIKPAFTADALVYGSTIHKAIEFVQTNRLFGDPTSVEEAREFFEKHWRKAAEGKDYIQYRKGASFTSLLNQGKKLMDVYVSNFPDNGYDVLALEEPFQLKLDGVDIPIIGVMDMVEQDDSGTIIITDHKTAARAFSSDEVDKNFQLTVYHMAALNNGYAGRDIVMKFDCLIKTKVPRFEQVYTVRSEEAEQRAVKKIKSVWDGICKGVFIPNDNSWRCSTCSFKDHCEKWHEN